MSDITPTFTGEMQLMNWGESSSNGAWVKFWITPEDLEAFRDLKCRSGTIAGHRLMAVLVGIADDETPVQQPHPAEEARPAGGHLAKLAALWCDKQDFWLFLRSNGCLCATAHDAAAIVRTTCNVESRAQLDHNTAAATIFHEKIRLPFMKWMQGAR